MTVRQPLAAERPVDGSTMWWWVVSPARQRRTVVDDVARPPCHSVTASSTSANAVRCESAIADGPAVGRWLPGDGDVAADADQHAAAGARRGALGREVDGERLRRRAEVEQDAGGDAHRAVVVQLDGAPARRVHDVHDRRSFARELIEAVRS